MLRLLRLKLPVCLLRLNHVPRHYSPRPISLSLARSQRIIELHQLVRAKYPINGEKCLIDQRAELVRGINRLRVRMTMAKSFDEFFKYKPIIKCAQQALADFDRAMIPVKTFEPKVVAA